MKYVLNIIQPDGPPPPPERLDPIMRDVRAFMAELEAAGARVWNAGLAPASAATMVRAAPGGEVELADQVQAAIQAVHAVAPTAAATDWSRIVALYDLLRTLDPSPIVALHRAVAVAEVAGPAVALAEVDALPLERHHLWHAVRGDLLARLGRTADAQAALAAAIARTDNAAEQRHLARALARLG